MPSDTDPSSTPLPFEGRTIALVGLMGAGKSTVGRRLAEKLGRDFYDSDHEIEKAAGLSISDIFAKHGEADFRRGEKQVIRRLLDLRPHVLATGGGAYLDADTRDILRERAITVWLNADIETLWRRVQKRDTRPLLQRADARDHLANLALDREPFYSKADLVVHSKDGPHTHTVNAILKALQTWIPQ